MKLVVGLGNPGKEYEKTRHNIGFDFLDYYAKCNDLKFVLNKKFNAYNCDFNFNNEKIILIKPLSFMNLSGIVVMKYIKFYNLSGDDILVIQDDLDMALGKIRISYNSSSGGHNGIKNIIESIGTKEFYRLKVGISNNKEMNTKDYVLGKFNCNDIDVINEVYKKIENIVTDFTCLNLNDLKQKYNSMNN